MGSFVFITLLFDIFEGIIIFKTQTLDFFLYHKIINCCVFFFMDSNRTKKFQVNAVGHSKIFILFYIRSLFLRRVSINIMSSYIFGFNLKSEKETAETEIQLRRQYFLQIPDKYY